MATSLEKPEVVKVAIVTNIPAPYRLKVYALLAKMPGILLRVFYCSGREPDRAWDLAPEEYESVYLKERFISLKDRFMHINPDVWRHLAAFKPDVVVTTGFNPSHLIAFVYAVTHRIRHIAMTDGTKTSEEKLSGLHRWIRRQVFRRTQAFVGASDGAFDLFEQYGVPRHLMFKSHLCANNEAFAGHHAISKRFDFIYCGRFVGIKNPLFALRVAHQCAKQLGRTVHIALVGSGEMEPEMRALAQTMSPHVQATFVGFAKQDELPQWYGASRVLLFPTSWDPWGVVANEACAAGVPVLVTPAAGVAGEIIKDQINGYILPLDEAQWVTHACRLLEDSVLHARMARHCEEAVADYTYAHAAEGIAEAVHCAMR